MAVACMSIGTPKPCRADESILGNAFYTGQLRLDTSRSNSVWLRAHQKRVSPLDASNSDEPLGKKRFFAFFSG